MPLIHGTVTGYQYYKCRCDECKKSNTEYMKIQRQNKNYWEKHQQDNKRKYDQQYLKIVEIKLSSGCVDCGYNGHPAALDFDHVSGEKEFSISKKMYYSWDRIEKEISKCEVVCANCHRVRTFERSMIL